MTDLILTTGDRWDEASNCSIDNGCHPEAETFDRRRAVAYIEQFRERIPLGRAIRLKCGACMGGELDQMPRGEVARAIDECGSCMCPLWPFRFGNDPWRPEASEAQIANARALTARRLGHDEAAVANSRENRDGDVSAGMVPSEA
jgi:hypothetical protein